MRTNGDSQFGPETLLGHGDKSVRMIEVHRSEYDGPGVQQFELMRELYRT
jgi:hypothetical protein